MASYIIVALFCSLKGGESGKGLKTYDGFSLKRGYTKACSPLGSEIPTMPLNVAIPVVTPEEPNRNFF